MLMTLLCGAGFALYVFWKVTGESNSYVSIPAIILIILGMVQSFRLLNADIRKSPDMKTKHE